MDGGWSDYKRSLSGFSGFDSGISTLKDKATTDKTKVFELDKLGLGEDATQMGNLKATLDTVGESAGGLATTMLTLRSYGAMRKHLSNISDKLGGKESNEEVGEKNSTAEKAKPTEEEGDATGDSVERGNIPETSAVNPETRATETPLEQSSTTIPETELGAGTEDTSEPSGFGGQYDPSASGGNYEMSNQANKGLEDFPSVESDGISAGEGIPSETGGISNITGSDTGLLTDIATEGADVAADASTGLLAQVFDAIPIVGEVVGAVVGIGAAVAGGIEAGKEALDEKQEDIDSKAELSINGASAVANKYGNSVTPTLTSLAQMPSNAGIF